MSLIAYFFLNVSFQDSYSNVHIVLNWGENSNVIDNNNPSIIENSINTSLGNLQGPWV